MYMCVMGISRAKAKASRSLASDSYKQLYDYMCMCDMGVMGISLTDGRAKAKASRSLASDSVVNGHCSRPVSACCDTPPSSG